MRDAAQRKPAADLATLERAISDAPIEARERLARLFFTKSALRTARLAERDEALLRMAVGLSGNAKSLADAVHQMVARYAASAWRFDRDRGGPRDQRHVLAWRVLKLNEGVAPAARTIRRAFEPGAEKKRRRQSGPTP